MGLSQRMLLLSHRMLSTGASQPSILGKIFSLPTRSRHETARFYPPATARGPFFWMVHAVSCLGGFCVGRIANPARREVAQPILREERTLSLRGCPPNPCPASSLQSPPIPVPLLRKPPPLSRRSRRSRRHLACAASSSHAQFLLFPHPLPTMAPSPWTSSLPP